jgi:hypothetical protein
MSLIKSESKIQAINEVGCRLDDVLENSRKETYRLEGAVESYKSIIFNLDNLFKTLSGEVDKENIDPPSKRIINSYIDRVRSVVQHNLRAMEEKQKVHAGKLQGFEQAVTIAKKVKDEELGKLQVLKDAITLKLSEAEASKEESQDDEGEEGKIKQKSVGRTPGTRPGPSIKLQRLAEEAVEHIKGSEGTDPDKNDTGDKPVEENKKASKKQKK